MLCPLCGGEMEIITFIAEHPTVAKTLRGTFQNSAVA
jgi:hypothetical protein